MIGNTRRLGEEIYTKGEYFPVPGLGACERDLAAESLRVLRRSEEGETKIEIVIFESHTY